MTTNTPPVRVAVDGSGSATEALRWAVAEAARTRRPLRVVTVHQWPITGYPDGLVASQDLRAGLRTQSEAVLAEAVAVVTELAPDLPVESEAVAGDPVAVLRAASAEAALLVLGSRGLGGFSGMLLGSTAVALSAHGHCPVVVVRGTGPHPARVVVGLDGGADEAVLAFAFEHAAATGATLVAAHGWSDPLLDTARVGGYPLVDWTALQTAADDLVTDRTTPWRAKFPEVAVERVIARSSAARVLLDLAADAALVVVGSRGRGGFAGLVLGSTSQALIRHSPCPVAVVRTRGA